MISQIRSQRRRGSLLQRLAEGEISAESIDQTQLLKDEEAFNRQALIVALTTSTAIIHIYVGGTLFVLNGIGFLVLLAAHYTAPPRESYRKWTRDGLMGYTGFTTLAYFIVRGIGGWTSPIGVASKLVELGLIRVLWADRNADDGDPVLVLETTIEELEIPVEEIAIA